MSLRRFIESSAYFSVLALISIIYTDKPEALLGDHKIRLVTLGTTTSAEP